MWHGIGVSMRHYVMLTLLILLLPLASAAQNSSRLLNGSLKDYKAKDDDVAQLLKKMERDWAQAIITADTARIRRILSPEVVLTTPEGTVLNREEDLAELAKGEFKADEFEAVDMQVKVYGDCAVVTGRTNVKGKYKGQDVHDQFRWTDTFVRRSGRWWIVASQATPIAK